MTITAQLADGRTLEFPDDTDSAIVQQTVKKLLAGDKYNTANSAVDYQASRFAKGAAGLATLPADLAFSVADLASRGLRMIPGYERYVADPLNSIAPNFALNRPSRVVQGALPGAGMQAPSREQEILGGASEFLGAGAPFSVSNIASAPHKAAAVAAELGSAALGGVGSETLGLPGAIAGSILGQNLPTLVSKAASVAPNVVPWLKGEYRAQAPRELQSALNAAPNAQQNIAAAKSAADRISDVSGRPFRPTLGQQSAAPGIIAREEQIAASTPEQISRYAGRASENKAALQAVEDVFFPATGAPLRRTADSVVRHTTNALESRLDNINKSRESLAQRLDGPPLQNIGERLSDLRDKAQVAARAVKNQKLADVYATAEKMGVKESMDDVLSTVRKVGGSDENIFQNMPPVFAKIVRQYGGKQAELTGRSIPPDLMAAAQGGKQKPASFEEIHSLWRETNTQYAAATRVGDTQAQYYLQQVKEALKGKLSKFEAAGQGELSQKFRDFNNFYATKYAPSFYEGVGGRMAASGRYGEVLKPEDVVSKFFTPSGIDDFNLLYSGSKEAQTALRDGVIAMFRESAVKNGKIDQAAASNFMRSNAETLEKLPDIAAALRSPVSADAAILESAKRVRQNIAQFNKSVVAKVAKTDNPDALIDKAITDKRSLVQLVELSKSGNSGPSVARAIVDRIPVAAQRAGVDPLTYTMTHMDTLKPALDRLGPNHVNNLITLMEGKAILGRTTVPTHVPAGKSMDAIEKVTGSTPRTIWSQANATTQGRQNTASAALHLLSRFGIKTTEVRAVEMMTEAIYNPQVAESWAKMAKGQKLSIGESNSFQRHLLAAGVRVAATGDEE